MRSGMTRRTALKTAALATTALISAPYVRGANAAGKISIGFWDHWVPGANKATEAIVNAWAEKEKVEVAMDFIPSQGNKNLITIAAEAQARSGHDIFAFPTWYCHANADISVKPDAEPHASEYWGNLAMCYPPAGRAWADAPNNRWLVSGGGALIMNPPSAWAVAKRDAPQVAEKCWTHGFPSGPKGRFAPFLPYFWGTWNFSKNIPAAKSLLTFLSQQSSAEKMVAASGG